MSTPLTDQELIDYCRDHAKTDRALFHKDMVIRMIALAQVDPVFNLNEWVCYKQSMLNLCEKAEGILNGKAKAR